MTRKNGKEEKARLIRIISYNYFGIYNPEKSWDATITINMLKSLSYKQLEALWFVLMAKSNHDNMKKAV